LGVPEAGSPPVDPYGAPVRHDLTEPARGLTTFERDGVLQVAVAREFGDDVLVLATTPDGQLTEQETVPAGDGPGDVRAIDPAATSALVSADTSGGTLTLLVPGETGALVPGGVAESSRAPRHLAVADLDGDGHREVLAAVGLGAEGGVATWKLDGGVL